MFRLVIWLMLAAANMTSTLHQRALESYRQQKYGDAIAAFTEAAKTETPESPEFKESALLISQSYFMLSQVPKAIPWLEKLHSVTEANYMLGYAYLQTAQRDKSRAAFARLFGVPEDSAAAYLVTAQMLMKKGYEDQAATEVQKAIELDPKIPQAHFLLAEVAIYRGRLEEGITLLNQELALDPNFSMAWYRRGDAYSRQEKWDSAIPDLQRAVWLNPDFSGPFILLGKCYFKKGDYTNAEGILRRALKLDPNNSSATYLLGQTLMLQGKSDEGRAVLQKWKTLNGQTQ
jgi:tetratricopeptide (TPR) repeat protein